MVAKCENCKHSQEQLYPSDGSFAILECRLNPPIPCPVHYYAGYNRAFVFTVVNPSDWCSYYDDNSGN